MKTVILQKVYQNILKSRGWDPATATITAAEMGKIEILLNERMREAWEYAFWPEIMEIEQRQYRATWDAAVNYSTDDEVYHVDADGDGHYYISLQDSNVNKDPDVETTWWSEVGDDFLRTIDFEQDGENPIGAADLENCVYDHDPRLYRDQGVVRPVIIYGEALLVTANEAPLLPWIRYRPPVPEWSLTEWAAGTAYAIEDTCYLASAGESYVAIAANTNQTPPDATYWEPVGFPRLFRQYIVHAVQAEYLLDPVESAKEEARAQAELISLVERQIDAQQVRKVYFQNQ